MQKEKIKSIRILLSTLIIIFLFIQSGCNKDSSIAVKGSPPASPTLIFPTNGATSISTSPTLSWNASFDATNYILQVSDNIGFYNYLFNLDIGSDTTKQITGLNPSTTYYWRVSAKNSSGTSWPSERNFTTTDGIIVQPPVLKSPLDNSLVYSYSPTLSWATSTNATSYKLQVSTSYSFTDYIFDQDVGTNISKQIPNLANNVKYFWRVFASNYNGPSPQSSIWSLTIATGGAPCAGIPNVIYEGKTYNTVQIGNQCWLKENIDIGIKIDSNKRQTNNGIIEKYCYDNDSNNCEIYGGLYNWNEAMAYGSTQGARGICPIGWHIPTRANIDTLINSVGGDGNALKATGQGQENGAGTNISGFSGLLSGYIYYVNGFSIGIGYNTTLWSSSQTNTMNTTVMGLISNSTYINKINDYKGNSFSVRCIKD